MSMISPVSGSLRSRSSSAAIWRRKSSSASVLASVATEETADCSVDTLDTQAIAFRWGALKGDLIYNDFMNLEPSGAQADEDIDVKDLQFVFGRFGSECADPHPPQDPENPQA